jgi:hypothetical protein
MSINVHIERLILEGFPSGQLDRATIGAAVETELAELLRQGSLDGMASRHESRVIAPRLALVRPTDPRAVGRQVGGALHQAIATNTRTTATP